MSFYIRAFLVLAGAASMCTCAAFPEGNRGIDFSYVINGNNDDRGLQVALDSAGNVYLAGLTLSSDFQTTPGAAFTNPAAYDAAHYQVFVRKLSPDGSRVLYSTYLGLANFYSGHPLGFRVDASGNAYIAVNGERVPPTGTAIDPRGAVAVYKLSPAGDRLLYSTKVMSAVNDTDPVALAIDGAGNAYVAAGSTTVYVSKIDPSGQGQIFLFQTGVSGYFGGVADVAVGSNGSVYVAGTQAQGVLVTTPGVVNPHGFANGNNGYLIRIKPDGTAPLFSTFVGDTKASTTISALAVDASGAAYVAGQYFVESVDAPPEGTPLGISELGSVRPFVAKISADGTASPFTDLLPGTSVAAIALDPSSNILATGQDATSDLMVARVNASGTALLSYSVIPIQFSATGFVTSPAFCLASDRTGAAWIAGSSNSLSVPANAAVSFPNASLLKLAPNPPQTDLSVVSTVTGGDLPQSMLTLTFTVRNTGSFAAENVVFSVPQVVSPDLLSCQSSVNGACGVGGQAVRLLMGSIAPGASETVTLAVASPGSPPGVTLAAIVSTSTSDINQDNNGAIATSTPSFVTLNIHSDLAANYVVTGAVSPTYPLANGIGLLGPPRYTVPNSEVTIYWPSPQESVFGTIEFRQWYDGSTENPRTFTATPPALDVGANFGLLFGPSISTLEVKSAGSYANNAVSPGELVTLFGFGLGETASGTVSDGRFTTTLGNTSVNFDGVPGPLIYVSRTQINTIVPYETAGRKMTTITVQVGSATASATVPVIDAVPALFTANASGQGQAAVLNQDLSINSPRNPASPGDVIALYGTGEGLVDPVPGDGFVSGYPAAAPKLPVSVTIGGLPADVLYAGAAPGLVAGVIQINARIPKAIEASSYVPVTWTAGTAASQDNVTIAVKHDLKPIRIFEPPSEDPTLPAIVPFPPEIPADTDTKQVTLYGRGFSPGVVVRWNNQPRATHFLDSTRLQVTLTGSDLESPGLGTLAVWDSAGIRQISRSAIIVVYIPVRNRYVVYDSLRGKIYVAAAATQAPQGSSIAVLDAQTGRIEQWHTLEAEPKTLALSGDNTYLYIGLGNIVRSINLNTWTPELDISMGQDQTYGTREAFSIWVLPGQNTSFAVSFYKTGLSPPYLGTAVFDGAQMRPNIVSMFNGPLYLIGMPDEGTLYGADSGDLFVMNVGSSGVTLSSRIAGLLGKDGDSVFMNGRIYDSWGGVVDPAIPTIVQTFDTDGLMLPIPELNEYLILGDVPPPGWSVFVSDPQLVLYNGTTGQRLWSVTLPLRLWSNHGPMIRCGVDCVALRESQVYASEAAPGVDLFRLSLTPPKQ